MDKQVAETVLNRAGHYCEACGLPGSDFALHHRKLRSQGGLDEPMNLIAVHHKCHNLHHHSIHLSPAKAVERGQIVPGWASVADSPLTLPDERKVLLDNEGNYIYLEDANGSDRSGW